MTATTALREPRIRVSFATADERNAIYQMRHQVYARELGQHHERPDGRLTDALDAFNHYLVATVDGRLAGFVSITPPGFGTYSIDKYFSRDELPFAVDDGLFEIRILTVDAAMRGSPVAALLMYASLRWVEDHGATRIMIIGRREVADLYARAGLRGLGRTVQSGAVTFELMAASVADVRTGLPRFAHVLRRLPSRVQWDLTVPFERPAGAFHGGASNDALGIRPSTERRSKVITADVLDAWFPPAPGVIRALQADAAFLASNSPPAVATELRDTIAATLGVDPSSVLPGAGLSDLIFRCLPRAVSPSGRVLLVEPQYAEYRHVLESVAPSRIDRIVIDSPHGIPSIARSIVRGRYALVVLVDPNNPLGYHLGSAALLRLIANAPQTTFWIDRTYAPFAADDRLLERFAATNANAIVGMSMSKAYALSGLRVGYLCGPGDVLGAAWAVTPPWNVSRAASRAAIEALADPGYYAARYAETAVLREELRHGLEAIPGIRPRDGVANYLLCDLEPPLDAASIVERAAAHGLYVRPFPSDRALRWRAIRIAVKDRRTQGRMLRILASVSREVWASRHLPAAEGTAPSRERVSTADRLSAPGLYSSLVGRHERRSVDPGNGPRPVSPGPSAGRARRHEHA